MLPVDDRLVRIFLEALSRFCPTRRSRALGSSANSASGPATEGIKVGQFCIALTVVLNDENPGDSSDWTISKHKAPYARN